MEDDKNSLLVTDFNYGIVSKNLMRDQSLTVQAKAIYALLCTYAGNKTTAFPGVGLIMHDLNISKGSYYKHMGLLKTCGWVTVAQNKDSGGKFKSNIYHLSISPYTKKRDTAKRDTAKRDTVKRYTNNNSLNNNNINNNNTKPPRELPAEATQLANRLFAWIEKNYPNYPPKKEHVVKWADSIDKINRIDGRPWKEIAEIIDWSQKNEFWSKNIQSGTTLRKQFRKLVVNKTDENKSPFNRVTPYKQIGASPAKPAPEKEIERADVNSEGYKRYQKMKEDLLKKKSIKPL